MAEDFTITANVPFPGPNVTGIVHRQRAITFRLEESRRTKTIWLDEEIATDEIIAAAIRRWIQEHPSP